MTCNRCRRNMDCVASTPQELGFVCKCGNFGIIRKEKNAEGKEEVKVVWDAIEVKGDATHPVYKALWDAVEQHRKRKKK